jgi:flagellar export protein FliJ
LKRLIRYRERLERLQEKELALRLRRQDERRAALAAVIDARRTLIEAPVVPPGRVQPGLLLAAEAYLQALGRHEGARRAALDLSAQEVADERARLLERRRDRRALEVVLERHLAAERLREGRDASRQLDEAGATRWLRGEA